MSFQPTNLNPVADDESNSVAGTSRFSGAATSAVSAFFDMDEENFQLAEQEFLHTNGSKPIGNTADAIPVDMDPGAVASPSSVLPFEDRSRGRFISPALAPVTHETRNTVATLGDAEAVAAVCRKFDDLLAGGAHSLRTAAAELGRSPSFFSGDNSCYARFKRHGVAGLLPRVREVASTMTVPAWFFRAARFFYLLSNRTHNGGSMPEAVRRTIDLPEFPFGWTAGHKRRFLKAIGCDVAPACPTDLRYTILSRQAAGRPLVPPSVAKQIIVNPSLVKFHRSPRAWSLDNQSAPGSQRRYTNKAGERQIMAPGDWFGGDDATPGIAVCVPCAEVITPCSQKFKVLLGRFQWLAFHDCRTDKILSWDYVVRPRGSYRAEDILHGMGMVTRTHGIPHQGWQFEGGAWNSKLVRESIRLMGCEHWRTYSPHQKAIESVFNRVWTRLAVQFPHADMGRYRNENESNCKVYEACKAGHQDPRRYFPTLDVVVKVFEEEIKAHNSKLIVSAQYGRWIPDELFHQTVDGSPLRPFSQEMEWMFSPFAAERTVQGMTVRCRVPMFEHFSIPFEFGADWLPMYNKKKVRIHFNPRQPRCVAKVVMLDGGKVLGDATLIGETAAHIRYILEWGDDNQRAGYLTRQRVANFVRREARGISAGGRVIIAESEERDGLTKVATLTNDLGGVYKPASDDAAVNRPAETADSGSLGHNDRSNRSESSPLEPDDAALADRRAARRSELLELEKSTAHLFV